MANAKGDAPEVRTIKINEHAFKMAVDIVATRMAEGADNSDAAIGALLRDNVVVIEAAKLQGAYAAVMKAMLSLAELPPKDRYNVIAVMGSINGFEPTGLFNLMNWVEKLDTLDKEKANGNKRH